VFTGAAPRELVTVFDDVDYRLSDLLSKLQQQQLTVSARRSKGRNPLGH